jgi:hypothetical protein
MSAHPPDFDAMLPALSAPMMYGGSVSTNPTDDDGTNGNASSASP